ncbi:MAG: hypothetical protein RR053_08650 [Evtepia sp.]
MEIPKSCGDCRFVNEDIFGDIYCDADSDTGREISPCTRLQLSAGRKDWCPLMEITASTWHIVADGDLPPKLKDGERAKSYFATQQHGRNDPHKETTIVFWNGEVFSEDKSCLVGAYGVLAWRELPEPWEGEGNRRIFMEGLRE